VKKRKGDTVVLFFQFQQNGKKLKRDYHQLSCDNKYFGQNVRFKVAINRVFVIIAGGFRATTKMLLLLLSAGEEDQCYSGYASAFSL